MKTLSFLVAIGTCSLCGFGHAAETPKFQSKTFQDILARVARRDKDSGAIIAVGIKPDAPLLGSQLNFSIDELPHEKAVVIVLFRNLKAGDGVYEKYRLREDDAIAQELCNQKKLVADNLARHRKFEERQTQKIQKLTKGTLKFGMNEEEVRKIKGEPTRVDSAQAAGSSTMVYPDMKLWFDNFRLQGVEINKP